MGNFVACSHFVIKAMYIGKISGQLHTLHVTMRKIYHVNMI